FRAWRGAFPELGQDWDLAWAGRLREGWRESLPTFAAGEQLATRAAGQKVMAALADHAPMMIGGAADLVESTKTLFEGAGEYGSVHAGRNVPFGIREHAMGAIVNGASAHGGIVKPYGSTFLIFSDYMRPAVRLSALMGLPVLWVWTHDSVALGEDGPTHQPVEHYSALRAIPRLWVIRPADANETSVGWRVALEREDGPVALLLSRQNIPVLDRGELAPAEGLERGGYVLWDSAGKGRSEGDSAEAAPQPELILIATGAEVGATLTAARTLAAEGTRARVVSMPCMELFEAQPDAYREEVLPADVTARLAVEPGARMSWWRWVGDRGDVLGLDRFGASAPGTTVLEKLGFNAENIADRARALIRTAD
ncbi:MAG TPA: transketolase C-terminal domain-containing protein, partial [Solirubrobacteraceae bacterium]|nr:transketolase C-terminal domain-containing protein [Solirubrobacteraceae bacterium]